MLAHNFRVASDSGTRLKALPTCDSESFVPLQKKSRPDTGRRYRERCFMEAYLRSPGRVDLKKRRRPIVFLRRQMPGNLDLSK